MNSKRIAFWAGWLVLLFSCGNNSSVDKEKDQADQVAAITLNEMEKPEDFKQPDTVIAPGPTSILQDNPSPAGKHPDWDKKIIKTAVLQVEVSDFNSYTSSLHGKVKQAGGYIAQEKQSQSDYKLENSLTIKVPVGQFENALNLLTADIKKLNEKEITSQDVTADVVDTRSRLEAKKQVRQRYLDLLKQARNMEEILNVQSEINGIQEEIESAIGRIGYLTHSSSYSTIHLTFYQVLNAAARDSDEPSFGKKISQAFYSGWKWVGELIIGSISVWPLLLLVLTIILVYKKNKYTKIKQA